MNISVGIFNCTGCDPFNLVVGKENIENIIRNTHIFDKPPEVIIDISYFPHHNRSDLTFDFAVDIFPTYMTLQTMESNETIVNNLKSYEYIINWFSCEKQYYILIDKYPFEFVKLVYTKYNNNHPEVLLKQNKKRKEMCFFVAQVTIVIIGGLFARYLLL